MKNLLKGTIVASLMLAGNAFAQGSALEPLRLTAGEMTFSTTPTGAQRANLAGDERKAGIYAYRTKFPANFRNQPHYHPDDRVVTVLSGTLYVGFGEKVDESAMKPLPAGSVWTEPSKQPHYVWAKDGEVMIQVIGFGPSGVVQVKKD